jgi:signal transduction histidine kinase
MTSFFKTLFQPSLTGRLLLAQVGVLFLLWGILVAFVLIFNERAQVKQDYELIKNSADFILQVGSNQELKSDSLNSTLDKFDDIVNGLVTSLALIDKTDAVRIFLWQRNELVYQSKRSETIYTSSIQNAVFRCKIANQNWLVFSKFSSDRNLMVVVMVPESLVSIEATTNYTWITAPLLASMPLLMFPAWFSVRIALKPWKQLSQEVAARKPTRLEPLNFKSNLAELKPLTDAVNGLFDRIRGARDREQSFVADAAHELRTPIAAIRINAEALVNRKLAPLDQELLNGLLKSNARASRLVEQLMALTRSEGAIDSSRFKSINLSNLIPECLAELAPAAKLEQVELSLNVKPNVFLKADEESLRALLENIVGNAIKYAPKGSVAIDVTETPTNISLIVSDEGPGIPNEQIPRVFDRFYRLAGQASPGNGLGLSIAQSVAMKHNAEISLRNKERATGLVVTVKFAKNWEGN